MQPWTIFRQNTDGGKLPGITFNFFFFFFIYVASVFLIDFFFLTHSDKSFLITQFFSSKTHVLLSFHIDKCCTILNSLTYVCAHYYIYFFLFLVLLIVHHSWLATHLSQIHHSLVLCDIAAQKVCVAFVGLSLLNSTSCFHQSANCISHFFFS